MHGMDVEILTQLLEQLLPIATRILQLTAAIAALRHELRKGGGLRPRRPLRGRRPRLRRRP